MKFQDDLSTMLNNKIAELSNGIDEKINNAAIQTKTVLDLSSAIRANFQKILEIANFSTDPTSSLSAVKSSIQNLSIALQGEENRVKNNYETLMARKQVLHDITLVLNEAIELHRHQPPKGQEMQQLSESKQAETTQNRPESIRSTQNVKKSSSTESFDSSVSHKDPIEKENTQDVSGASSVASHIYNVAGTQDDPGVGEEIPTHVSRFFKG